MTNVTELSFTDSHVHFWDRSTLSCDIHGSNQELLTRSLAITRRSSRLDIFRVTRGRNAIRWSAKSCSRSGGGRQPRSCRRDGVVGELQAYGEYADLTRCLRKPG